MLKTILLCVSISALSLTISAQNLKDFQVPAAAKAAFTKANPNTMGNWEKEGGNYEVVYKVNGKQMSSIINKNGSVLETETDLSNDQLPQIIKAYINSHSKGAKVGNAAKVVKANSQVNYEVTVNGKELEFDNEGRLLKNEKKEKED